MATYSAVFVPTSPTAATLFSASLGATTSTADITVGARSIIAISMSAAAGAVAPAGLNIRFGNATRMVNAAATDFFLPPGIITYFETGEEFDRLRLFNASAASVTYYIYVLSQK